MKIASMLPKLIFLPAMTLAIRVPRARGRSLSDRYKLVLGTCAVAFLIFQKHALAGPIGMNPERQLNVRGFPCQTEEDIGRALSNTSPVVRELAVQVVAQRGGPRATDLVRPHLTDSYLNVRIAAALALSHLGDETGRTVLRTEFAALSLNIPRSGQQQFISQMNASQLADIVEIADALAQMGDTRGVSIAVSAAQFAPLAAVRYRAVRALCNMPSMPNADAQIRRALLTVAETDQNEAVQKELLADAESRLRDRRLAEEIAMAVRNSPHAAPNVRATAESLINDIRKTSGKR